MVVKGKTHIEVTVETHYRLKKLAGDVSMVRYLDHLTEKLISEKENDKAVIYASDLYQFKVSDDPLILLTDNEVVRNYDYDYRDRYLSGKEFVGVHPELVKKGYDTRYYRKWRRDHGDEILEYYRNHCPEATAKRFKIMRKRLNVVLFEAAGIPTLAEGSKSNEGETQPA